MQEEDLGYHEELECQRFALQSLREEILLHQTLSTIPRNSE